MKSLKPVHATTRVHTHTREWLPASTEALFAELKSIKERAMADGRLLFYRGHRCREWRLDSTFVRSVKTKMFGMQPHDGFSARLQNSVDLNSALTSLLLFKFGTLSTPSNELFQVESDHGIDAWFELLKRFQQYSKEDLLAPAGTNFLDWSQSSDVGLYFANELRAGEGAIFVCDATATGKTQQTLPVIDILDKIRERFMQAQSNGVPLLFSPPRQIANQRAKNQQAVYFAQMDLRLDMTDAWRLQETSLIDETIVQKLVLPAGSENEISNYLADKGVNSSFIYPD